jgi:ketosteroid isomerase-like protein
VASANVDFVRQAFEVWDAVGVAGAMPYFDSGAEMELGPATLDEGVISGREAIVDYLTSVVEQLWDAFAIEGTNYEDVGERHVVVDVRLSGRGRVSGAPAEQRFVEAFELRGESIVWMGFYPDRATALEAVKRQA